MPAAEANGITIEYETLGSPDNEPMLMVMGHGAQLVLWPPAFLELLVDAGYFVIVYDNRDVGLSTKVTGRVSYGSASCDTSPIAWRSAAIEGVRSSGRTCKPRSVACRKRSL